MDRIGLEDVLRSEQAANHEKDRLLYAPADARSVPPYTAETALNDAPNSPGQP